jgi:CheY-like chemotaxis protein
MNILLVDDNVDDVFLFEEAHRKAGVFSTLHSVNDGVEAVAYLRGEGAYADRSAHPMPDVVLLDLNMPRMNGFEFLEWVRKDERCGRLIVHVLSSSCRDVDIDRAYDLHANSYMMKPSRMDELVRLVAALDQWHHFARLPRATEPAVAE